METNFQIGNLYFSVRTPVKMKWTNEVKQFQTDVVEDAAKKISIQLEFQKEINPIYGKILYRNNQSIIMDVNGCENDVHLLPKSGEPFAVTEHISNLCLKVLIDERFRPYIWWNRVLLGLFALEHLSLECRQFLLHASYVIYNGKAIVFSAPSGTGKSTQADLWAKYAGAEIINGDRVLMLNRKGKWYAGGFPMSGSSPFCLNKMAPIKAVVCLDQGLENIVEKIKPAGAFGKLYSQSFVNRWNTNDCQYVGELLNSLCQEIPIYMYTCVKEKSAVDCLKQILSTSKLI